MTVSTNPTGLAAGTILSGTVTIQTTGLSPTQTIQVPVSLSIGDVHALAVPVEPAATPTPTSTPSNSATATAIASQPTPTATPVAGTPAASFKDYVSIVLNGQIAGW